MASVTPESPHMPDLVTDKILGLLPTKLAVKVSFLSHQWQGVVSSYPSLNFDEEDDFGRHKLCSYNYVQCQHQHIKFINFLERYLDFRDKHGQKKPVEKLSLHMRMYTMYSNRDEDIVTKWLEYACQGGLKELDINLISSEMSRTVSELLLVSYSYLDFYRLPLVTISRAEYLTSLELGFVGVPFILRGADEHVADAERLFPSLKFLSFNAIWFVNDADLYSFLSECPSIEHLSLTRCWIENNKCYICCSSLKYLEVKNCLLNDIRVDQAFNLESFSFVSLPDSTCENMFLNSTLNLKYINISVDKHIEHFSLHGCHSALEASIESPGICKFEFFDGYLSAKVLLKAKEGTVGEAIIDNASLFVRELSDKEWFSSDSTYVPRVVTFLRRFSCCKKINLYIQNLQALTFPINYRKMTSLLPLPKTRTLNLKLPDIDLASISGDKFKFGETMQWIAPSATIWIKLVDFEEDRKRRYQRASIEGNRLFLVNHILADR